MEEANVSLFTDDVLFYVPNPKPTHPVQQKQIQQSLQSTKSTHKNQLFPYISNNNFNRKLIKQSQLQQHQNYKILRNTFNQGGKDSYTESTKNEKMLKKVKKTNKWKKSNVH